MQFYKNETSTDSTFGKSVSRFVCAIVNVNNHAATLLSAAMKMRNSIPMIFVLQGFLDSSHHLKFIGDNELLMFYNLNDPTTPSSINHVKYAIKSLFEIFESLLICHGDVAKLSMPVISMFLFSALAIHDVPISITNPRFQIMQDWLLKTFDLKGILLQSTIDLFTLKTYFEPKFLCLMYLFLIESDKTPFLLLDAVLQQILQALDRIVRGVVSDNVRSRIYSMLKFTLQYLLYQAPEIGIYKFSPFHIESIIQILQSELIYSQSANTALAIDLLDKLLDYEELVDKTKTCNILQDMAKQAQGAFISIQQDDIIGLFGLISSRFGAFPEAAKLFEVFGDQQMVVDILSTCNSRSVSFLSNLVQYTSSETLCCVLINALTDHILNATVEKCPSLVMLALSIASHCPEIDDASFLKPLDSCISVLFEFWGRSTMWMKLFAAFSKFAFNSRFLKSENPEMIMLLEKVFKQIILWSHQRIGVLNHIASTCHILWKNSHDMLNLNWFLDMLLLCPDRLSSAEFFNDDICDDKMIRVLMFDVLLCLKPQHLDHKTLAAALVTKLNSLLGTKGYFSKFSETKEQRKSIRMLQSYLIVLSFLNLNQSKECFDILLSYLNLEQPSSTRVFAEWIIMRILIRFPELLERFWLEFKNLSAKSYFTTSLITITMYIGPRLFGKIQDDFYKTIFSKLTFWLSSNHMSIRLCAQFCFYETWNYCIHAGIPVPIDYEDLYQFIDTNSDCDRKRKVISKMHFHGCQFDPVKDLNVEFLLRDALQILNVGKSEMIAPVIWL